MKHECPIRGCAKKVDSERGALCSDHYQMLPVDLRAPLARAYNRHLPVAEQAWGFFDALAKVQGWITVTFGAEDRRQGPSWESLVAWVRERDAARAARRAKTPTVDTARASS